MQLSVLGEDARGHKLEHISSNVRLNKICLRSLIYILLGTEKAKQPPHTSHTTVPLTIVNLADFIPKLACIFL
jgi:hypothetical protein